MEEPLRAHADAVAQFVTAARAIPSDRWEAPMRPGQWSPAQVAEHLRLTYATAVDEQEGRPGLCLRSPWWMRPFLRWRYLRGPSRRCRSAPGPGREGSPLPGDR